MKDKIKKIANEIRPALINNRRHLHSNPELSFQEYNTSAFVAAKLREMNISFTTMSGTGLVAMIKGNKPSDKVVALRADMDALPIKEENATTYKSTCEGIMHACGHDAHTSSLLGVAHILNELKDEFAGSVKLIFQPGEEKLPGGASLMIKDGVLKDPVPAHIIGQHVSPNIEAGKIALRTGKFMASMDEIFMTIKGKGGHGAQPHLNIDPVVITSQIILALQQVVSRVSNPSAPTVLSFGKVIANGAINIIPDEVYLEGTFRTMDEAWRKKAHEQIRKIATGIAESMGAVCELKINTGYPCLINEETTTNLTKKYAEEYLGKENVMEAELWMAAEDFAAYSQQISGCFYLLGVSRPEKEKASQLHTSTFDINEEALPVGAGIMAFIALKHLGN